MLLHYVFVGSEEKLAACKGLGADVCINYKTEDFVARVKEETNGKGTSHALTIFVCSCSYYFPQPIGTYMQMDFL